MDAGLRDQDKNNSMAPELKSFDPATTGLALVFLLAGSTKFLLPSFWTGYEPEFLRSLSLVTSHQLLYIAGVSEILLGVWLSTGWRKKFSAAISTLWLSAITVQVTSLGLYAIAIRDLGLVFLALTVLKDSLVPK